KWQGVQRRYRAELENNLAVRQLQQLLQNKPVITFVYPARDAEQNSAQVLKGFLEEHSGAGSTRQTRIGSRMRITAALQRRQAEHSEANPPIRRSVGLAGASRSQAWESSRYQKTKSLAIRHVTLLANRRVVHIPL